MTDSILNTLKASLGLTEDDTNFDVELVMHVNSVLSFFNQLGLGPDEGYAITDANDTWEDFMGTELRYNDAKQLMYYKVRMAFDAPTVGYVVTAYEKMIEEATQRLSITREELTYPAPPPVSVDPSDVGEEFIILDGGGG